ncbi:hypothetical protein [Magnetospirillum sp. UT-4]|uniref:hypothetical protein n=1 Tax=Magnetospirillum sp. UT-4 TaxID=2681467 RepID=UPI0013803170|nr:hypothetical protein [Magnetospirillum sp. UT-4]CAA7626573.1 hypothetical protein MTBUT4_80112 [Magnetospirillum sp. UT-4]
MLNHTVIVTFTAPEHSGKTTLEAAFAKLLQDHGIPVRMPPDAQREEKMALPMDQLLDRFREKGMTILVMESNAT